MRAVEINLFPNQNARDNEDQFYEELENFLSALRGNGNICDDWVILELEGQIQVRAVAPALDARDPIHWSIYAHRSYETLATLFQSPPQMHIVPEVGANAMCCDCPHSSSSILYSTHNTYPLPVDCLDCGRPIPLYRLPYLNEEEEHWTLRQWHRNYQTLDQLFMNSAWGERMAYSQLSNPRSGFIKYSREVAANLEKATGTPTYVFLLNMYEPREEACYDVAALGVGLIHLSRSTH